MRIISFFFFLMLKTNEMAHEQSSLSVVLIKSLQKYHNLRRAASQLNVQAILREVISVIKKKSDSRQSLNTRGLLQ